MTVSEMQAAMPVINKLLELKLPIRKAHAIFILAKEIDDNKNFVASETQKLVERYNAEIGPMGEIKIENEENRQKFIEEYNGLMQYDIFTSAKPMLSLDELGDAEFTAREVAMLKLIIDIVE